MILKLSWIFICGVLVLARPVSANDMSQATADVSPELVSVKSLKKIPDLTWNPEPVSVDQVTLGGKRVPVARFRGRVPSMRGGNLLYSLGGELKVAKVSEDAAARVDILVPLTVGRVTVRVRAIDEYGRIYDDAIEIRSVVAEKFAGKRFNADVGTGISYLDYSERFRSRTFKVTEIGLTVKGGVNYQLSHRWEIGGNGFITAYPLGLTLTTTPTSRTAMQTARWFGLNGRAGYRLAQLNPRASLHILAGYYVWGMLTSPLSRDTTYGVEQLGGPQLFLTGRFRLKDNRFFATYLKFASIQDAGLFSLTSREIAIGAAYQISTPREGKRRWMLTLDLANASWTGTVQEFSLGSYSIGVGTNF